MYYFPWHAIFKTIILQIISTCTKITQKQIKFTYFSVEILEIAICNNAIMTNDSPVT